MKHEYLIELLKQNKTVIVPNVGAFSNNENPNHPFLFNEYLKFNDGMIAKHIATKEGISMDAAGDVIDKFTNELKELLGAGKEVVIPGIGTLSKKEGKVILGTSTTTSVSSEKKADPPKMETPKITPQPEIPKVEPPKVETPKVTPPKIETPKAETPKIDPPKAEAPKIVPPKVEAPKVTPPKIETPKAETPKIDPPKVEIPKVVPPKVEAPKVDPPKMEVPKIESPKAEVPKNDPPKQESPKVEAPKAEVPKKVKEAKPRKKRKLVWLIILLLLLGGGGTAGYLYKDDLMKMVGMGESATAEKETDKEEKKGSESKTQESVSEDNTELDTAVAVTPVEEVKEEPVTEEKAETKVEETPPAPVVAETASPGTYYIIVGCFEHQPNADNMISKVSAAGMTPTNVGTFNSLIHVAAGSASDMGSATQTLNSVRGTFQNAWIMKR